MIIYRGPDAFNYDANGDISIELSEVIHTIEYDLVWPEGKAAALKDIKWTYPKDNTLIENSNVDVENEIISFSIKPKYRQNLTNNTFKVAITTLEGKIYNFEKEIIFTKDGEQGTNGTSYAALIRPCDKEGQKQTGYWYLYPGESINLKAYLYKDGDMLDITASQVTWHKTDGLEIVNNGTIIELTAKENIDLDHGHYVSADITINADGQRTKVHYTLPVHLVDKKYENKTIDAKIPNFVQYNLPGYTPSYDTGALEVKVNGEAAEATFKSLSNSLLEIKNGKIKPVNNYVYEEESIAVIECTIDNMKLYHSIVYYLNLYGNSVINGWNHKEVFIDDNFVLAPMIGAGTKNTENAFTGIIMGNDIQQKMIGLYGYNGGVNSFGLLENGNAYFGPNKEIYFDVTDPENVNATIAGWDIGTNKLSSPSSNTVLYANGRIDCDLLYADSGGSIGGWEISSEGLTGGKTTLNSDGTITCNKLVADTSGSIGGWTIGSNGLIGGSTTLNKNGTITCSNLIANTSGSIGGWTISSNGLIYGDFKISPNGDLKMKQLWLAELSVGSDGADGYCLSANGNVLKYFGKEVATKEYVDEQYDIAYTTGWSAGKAAGIEEGYDQGWTDGYNRGKADASTPDIDY